MCLPGHSRGQQFPHGKIAADDEILHEGRLEAAKVSGSQQRNEKGYDCICGPTTVFADKSQKSIFGGTHSINL